MAATALMSAEEKTGVDVHDKSVCGLDGSTRIVFVISSESHSTCTTYLGK